MDHIDDVLEVSGVTMVKGFESASLQRGDSDAIQGLEEGRARIHNGRNLIKTAVIKK